MCSQINNINELEEGDIVEFPSKVPDNRLILPGTEVPFVLHYGIIIIQDGEKKMGHNTFNNYPKIDDIEKVLNGRKINRIIRTGIKSDELLNNHNKLTDRKYDAIFFNCEDYLFKVTGVKMGLDQRVFWILFIIMIILIILVFIKE